MRTFLTRAVIALNVLFTAASVSAQPQGLERVGPTSPANGFPTWYQDKTGLALEFCQPQTQAELDGGWCLLLPGDTTVPEAFPGTFADEHFFFAADASIATPNVNAILVLAVEAAFAAEAVINGDQIVFARVRVRFDAPATGTYTIYHPYGTDVVEGVQGERVFVTEDIGIQCAPGNFSCALNGRIGPFLLASDTPGGAELPAVQGPVAGELHIARPDRLGPVTGSPLGQNFFRIVGPNGTVLGETSQFSLMGRLYQGTMPGKVTVDRASYSRAAGATNGKTDVFATALPTIPARLPGMAPAPVALPALTFFPTACAPVPVGEGLPMVSDGSRYYGQLQDGPIPLNVCVKDGSARDINGQVVPLYREAPVTDEVIISQAVFDPTAGVLNVVAASSDLAAPPSLSALNIGPLNAAGEGQAEVVAPPAKAFVTSANGGQAELAVRTVPGELRPPTRPFAGNDTARVDEDDVQGIAINVLLNDRIGVRPIDANDNPLVAIVGSPRLGDAVVNADGTIGYRPNANMFATDLLMYTVTVGPADARETSSAAYVTITITPVPDAPVAVDDIAQGSGGLAIQIPVLANDSDTDGAADLVAFDVISAPAGLAYSGSGTLLTVSGSAGTYVLTYQARDRAGLVSNSANVTVTITATETITILRSEYTQNKRRWRVEGTDSVAAAQTVYIMYANGTFADGSSAAGYLIGTARVDALRNWVLDFALAGTNDPRNPTAPLFAIRPTAVYAVTAGGASQPAAIVLR